MSTASYVHGASDKALIGSTIGSYFDAVCARYGEREALVVRHQNVRMTYAAFKEAVDNLACGFLRLGLKPGDRIGIWSQNNHEWVLTQFATAKAGLVMVNINPAYRRAELEYVLNKVGCRALILAPSFKSSNYLEMLQDLAPELAVSQPGQLRSVRLPQLEWVVRLGDETTPGMLNFGTLLANASRAELNELLQQLFEPTRKFLLATVTVFGRGLLQLLLVIFFVFFILRDAPKFAALLRSAAYKLGGELGERMLNLARGTVTGVMVGIVGTAAAQALVGGMGYLIAGVPGVVVLTFATFIFSMVPVIGPTLIWGGAAAWLYSDGQSGWAIFMALWGILAISGVDNFVKPILISRTAALPLILIIVGVFGGVLVFGFIGLFLGPALLALGQALVREWLADDAPALTRASAHD